MTNEEQKLKKFIADNHIEAEHLRFKESLHSVQQLLRVTGIFLDEITKTMVFASEETIAAMIPAKFRVSVSRLSEAVGFDVELTDAQTAYRLTGYPVGGMPCFGYNAILVIDPKVLEKDYIYTGGGSEFSVVRISTKEILRTKNPLIKKIIGKKSN